jgi:hypothetical protein
VPENLSSFLIVFFAPLLPALLVGIGIGIATNAQATGSLFGIKFHAQGGLAAYVICAAVALLVYSSVVQRVATYELAFKLRGSSEARDDFLKRLDGFQATLKNVRSTGDDVIFRQFSVDSSRTRIVSSLTLPPPSGDGPLNLSIFPESTELVSLAVAPARLELGRHMEAVLEIKAVPRDNDPLTTSNVKFSRDDWVLAFEYAVIAISGDEPETKDEIRQLFIFRNETQQSLSVIRVPSYQLEGSIFELEMYARAISGSLVESGLVEHRGPLPNIRSKDSPQLLSKLDALLDYYRLAGTEIGYFSFKDGKQTSDPLRSERIKVTANNSLWSIGPIAEGIRPGDAVAVIVRIKSGSAAKVGKTDHFGILLPYPTRIFYQAVQNRVATLQIDPSAVQVDVTERNGTKGRPSDGSLNKTTASSVIFSDFLLDRDSKVQLRWTWDRAETAK